MNGKWFWWGQKTGPNGYKKPYRMHFKRLVYFYKLNNLLWVFNANEKRKGVGPYEDYYPGRDVVDILATDVYTEGFAEKDYHDLMKLAAGKPIALGEVGRLPAPEILGKQPRWVWWMRWGERARTREDGKLYRDLTHHERIVSRDELPWVTVIQPIIHFPALK